MGSQHRDLFVGDKKVPPVKQLVKSEEGKELQGQDPRRPEQNVFDFRTLTNPSQVSVSSSHPSMSVGHSTVSTSQPTISSHNHMPNLSIPPPSLANQSGLPSLANQNSPQFSRNNSIEQVKRTLFVLQVLNHSRSRKESNLGHKFSKYCSSSLALFKQTDHSSSCTKSTL